MFSFGFVNTEFAVEVEVELSFFLAFGRGEEERRDFEWTSTLFQGR